MSGLIEWIIFLTLSLIAVVTAAGMILTMSMYRAGLALMASFVALAGLFLLLSADLLAAIQVMMNVGGMLVMVLFMVMMMMDPGGEMMWGMKRDMRIPGPAAFSMTMPRGKPPEEGTGDDDEQQDHPSPAQQMSAHDMAMGESGEHAMQMSNDTQDTHGSGRRHAGERGGLAVLLRARP
jgi:NADH-quinone oxidoreductase subunit J